MSQFIAAKSVIFRRQDAPRASQFASSFNLLLPDAVWRQEPHDCSDAVVDITVDKNTSLVNGAIF